MSKQTFKTVVVVALLSASVILASSLILGASHPAPASAQQPPDIAMVPGTVDVEERVENAVRQALADGRSILPATGYYAISGLRKEDNWLFASVVGLQNLNADLSWNLFDNGVWFGLVLLRQDEDGRYTGAVEGATQFSRLLAEVPKEILSDEAKQDLDPLQRCLSIASTSYRFPWESGTMMYYGPKGVHDAEFPHWVPGWKAVDFVSDGNTSAGHAPNHLLAAAAGTIGPVCDDGTSVAILVHTSDLLYAHLLYNSNLETGKYFSQGEEIGQLRPGDFSPPEPNCGYADNWDDEFHVHWGFPDTGSFQVEDWTLNLSDGLWRRDGEAPRGVGNWFLASGSSSGPKVELFGEANYQGTVVFSEGKGFHDNLEANSYSMKIPGSWSVKTWRGNNRTGEERCWWESVPNLQDHGWHLAIQSIEVFEHNACPQVELFSRANYQHRVFSGVPGFHDNLEANSYSMRIPSGWSVKTWRDSNRGGEERCWWESVPNLQDHGWHLAIQSIEVHDHDVCPHPVRLNFTTGLGHEADVEIVVTTAGDVQDWLSQDIVTTDSQGDYTGGLLLPEQVKPGRKYDIYAKPSTCLRRRNSDVQLNEGINTIHFDDFIAGDTNWDNAINYMDLARIVADWGQSQSPGDVNGDGVVGFSDFSLVVSNWGEQGEGWTENGPSGMGSNATAVSAQDTISPQTMGSITLAPDTGVFNVGDTFDMQVILDTGGYDADGVDLMILYDPGVLEVQDAEPITSGIQISAGSIYTSVRENWVNPAVGEIRFSAEGDGHAFQGSGVVATVTLRVVASISNTAVRVYYGDGWTAETNIVESQNVQDVLGQANIASFQTTGSPSRLMPTVSFTPSTNAILNSSLIELEAEVTDPYTQVEEVKFEVNLNGTWTTIGSDTYSPNGWGLVWDGSSVTDGSYELRATALLPGGEGTTVTNTSIILDRVPPMYVFSAFTPSAGMPVTIEVIAADEGSGIDHIDVYAKPANDSSENEIWAFLGSIPGSQGSLVWDTSSVSAGTYQIAFAIYDRAGNQGPEPQPQLFFEKHILRVIYLPLVLRNFDPSNPPTPTPTPTPTSTPTPTPGPSVLFQDDFSDPSSGWTTHEESCCLSGCDDAREHLDYKYNLYYRITSQHLHCPRELCCLQEGLREVYSTKA